MHIIVWQIAIDAPTVQSTVVSHHDFLVISKSSEGLLSKTEKLK